MFYEIRHQMGRQGLCRESGEKKAKSAVLFYSPSKNNLLKFKCYFCI